MTPFGGLAVPVEFWREPGLLQAVRERLPFEWRSPNASGAAEILLSFWLSVCAGARRFAHVKLLRGDVALRHPLGWKRLPGDDATRAFFGRFGRQEGARKGYKPRRPGRLSHHPLLAALGQHHRRTRRGRLPRRGAGAFAQGLALARGAGRFDGKLLEFLEERKLPCIVVARLRSSLKRAAAGVRDWRRLDQHHDAGEFAEQLAGRSRERRFVVIRERVREGRAAVGRKLIKGPGYTCRLFVTNRDEAPELVGRDHHLLSLWQTAARPGQTYRRPATLRTEAFLCGAIARTDGLTPVLNLSRPWGGLEQRIPLLQNTSLLCRAFPPRLHPRPNHPSPKKSPSPYENLTL